MDAYDLNGLLTTLLPHQAPPRAGIRFPGKVPRSKLPAKRATARQIAHNSFITRSQTANAY